MNRVLRLLEKTGHKVVVTSERKPRTMAMIDGEEIPFSLGESSRRTEHVARFGATEWPRARFLRSLQAALRAPTRRGRWALDAPAE